MAAVIGDRPAETAIGPADAMPSPGLAVPIALLIFNRPDTTARVFAAIRAARPARLLIVADGPRPGRADDAEKCAAARAVVATIDWPCAVARLYVDTNMGCRRRVASGLDWVFEREEEAIILEDDCVPDPSFFPYCVDMLARYRDDPRVMTIAGHRIDGPDEFGGDSYFFARYPIIWGWATWRRAWRRFDIDIAAWPALRETSWLAGLLHDERAVQYWRRIFDSVRKGYDTWDYSLLFACWRDGGLSALPKINMVANIGFRADATHTTDPDNAVASRVAATMPFPLRHPVSVAADSDADRRIEWVAFSGVVRRTMEIAMARIRARRRIAPAG